MPVVVADVVLMVSVEVGAPGPVILKEVGFRLAEEGAQVRGLLAPAGAEVTAQLRFTVPVNPPEGVTKMMVELVIVFP